jgi:hypothetical protein
VVRKVPPEREVVSIVMVLGVSEIAYVKDAVEFAPPGTTAGVQLPGVLHVPFALTVHVPAPACAGGDASTRFCRVQVHLHNTIVFGVYRVTLIGRRRKEEA